MSIYAKTVLQNLKIFWFWTMGVLNFYICTFASLEEKKSCNLCPSVIIFEDMRSGEVAITLIHKKKSKSLHESGDKILC